MPKIVLYLCTLLTAINSSGIKNLETTDAFNTQIPGNQRFLETAVTTSGSVPSTTSVIFGKCKTDADCLNGLCDIPDASCRCFFGYLTHWTGGIETTSADGSKVVDYSQSPMCNYKLKSQLTAFMLSIFVGFGAEHFYMERLDTALAKLFFYIGCCLANVVFFIIYRCFPSKRKYLEFLGTFETLYLGCGVFFILLWNIYDWVNIGYNVMPDGYGFPLVSWDIK
jgi:hypothetical protein